MVRQTIVVIDAGPTLEEKITATLEAAGYTVFTGPSGVVGPDVLKNLAPSLIYIKPLAPSRAGFEPCKTIHAHPGLKHIPVVLLASLRGSLDSRYFNIYGIVDSLKPSFTRDELIEKTERVLGNIRPSWLQAQDVLVAEEPAVRPDAVGPGIGEEDRPRSEESSAEAMRLGEEESGGLSWLQRDKKEDSGENAARTAPWARALEKKKRRRPLFLIGAVGAVILMVIVGAVVWLYRPASTPPKTEHSSAPVPAPSPPVSSQTPESGPAQKSPEAPASPTPPAQPVRPVQTPPSSQDASSRPGHKPVYSVQLGVFKNEDNARTFEKSFREKGYDVFTRTGATRDGSPLHRVLAGRFDDRKAAEKLAEEIQSKENINPAVRKE